MARLTTRDYRGVLDVLRAIGYGGEIPLGPPALEALRRLVPCDVAAFHQGWPGTAAAAYAGEPRGVFTAQMRTAQARYWRQDGLEPADGARKISDSLSRREWHRQEFYAEVARPLGVEHMMRLWIHPDGSSGARVEFDRADKDFTERDREALDLLLPHLRRAVRMHGEKGHLVTRREREVLALVGDGYTNAQIARTLWISTGTVRKHLENAYEKLGVHTRTGAVAALGLSARGVERKTADR